MRSLTLHMFFASISIKPEVVLNEEHDKFLWIRPEQAPDFDFIDGDVEIIDYYKNLGLL